jgi:uncharacterized membrane protein YGL010W
LTAAKPHLCFYPQQGINEASDWEITAMASKGSFFVEQMAQYSSYHRDWRNRATHLVGIPAIAFALLVAMALARWTVGGTEISLAMIFMAATLLFYVILDLGLGLAMLAFYVPILLVAEWTAAQGTSVAWITFGIFFVGGWVLQLWGHIFEGRRPALVDNILQALIGPMFIMTEIIIAAGFRKALHEEVEARWQAYAENAGNAAGETPAGAGQ